MFDRDELADRIVIFLEKNGIEPLYAVTIFSILISLSYWGAYKKWNKIERWRKHMIIATLIGTIGFIIISLLQLFGVVKNN